MAEAVIEVSFKRYATPKKGGGRVSVMLLCGNGLEFRDVFR
jgi:hypothetical protein